jgi:hypothetical protein
MYLVYFDESGDDGYPKYSSELFVLTSCYLHHQKWQEIYNSLKEFRKQLKQSFGIPIKLEFKAREFILNKNPYRKFNISDNNRKKILEIIADFLGNIEIKFINVVINKKKIKKDNYPILENALKFNIQRIENDLNIDPLNKFLIITDEGRVGKMRYTTRKIQKINIIPSKFIGRYRREIKLLIEDPLPKKSQESYFIQMCDFVAFLIYLYGIKKFLNKEWSNRLSTVLNLNELIRIINKIKPVLNLKATNENEYGIVCYPK